MKRQRPKALGEESLKNTSAPKSRGGSASIPRKPQPEIKDTEARESQIFLDSIVENIPDMIFVKDAAELRFVRFNKVGEDLLGYSREELIGKNDYDFFPKQEADFFTSKDREVLKAGKLVEIPEEPIHTRFKGPRILHTKKIPILDEDGRPLYLLGISEDITDKKRVEEQLLQYADIVKNIQTAFFIWKREGSGAPLLYRLAAANPATSQVTGRNMQDSIGKSMEESIPCLMDYDFIDKFETVIKQGEELEMGEIRIKCQGCPNRDWDVRIFPLPDKCVGVAFRDITARKKIELEMLNIINREQMRIGQDLHDGLGQDLTAVAFLAKVLEKKMLAKHIPEADKLGEIAQLVNQCITKAKNITRGLHLVELDGPGFISALKELAINTETLYNISCYFRYAETVVIKDSNVTSHLYRIAQEAVRNAIRHAEAKNIEIALSYDEGRLALTVNDDGVGISDLENKKMRGMGLSIMEYRAKMIGGTLTIQQGPKGGTQVRCALQH